MYYRHWYLFKSCISHSTSVRHIVRFFIFNKPYITVYNSMRVDENHVSTALIMMVVVICCTKTCASMCTALMILRHIERMIMLGSTSVTLLMR